MTEKLLFELKEEVEKEVESSKKYNADVKRFRELLKEPLVKEYLNLVEKIGDEDLELIKNIKKSAVLDVYRRFIYKINKEDTNKIFVYMGTYKYSLETDIIHGSNDIRVNYDDPSAIYRLFWDIEQDYPEQIAIKDCESFMKDKIILDTKLLYGTEYIFYQIQQEFFEKMIETSQEAAKRMILKKYERFNR